MLSEVLKERVRLLAHQKERVEKLQALLKEEQSKYDALSRAIVADFHADDLIEVTAGDGTRFRLIKKRTCSIAKDSVKRHHIASWLRKRGADFLVTEKVSVSPSALPLLEEHQVPFSVEEEMNTNSVKAYLNTLETIDELPSGLHYFTWEEVESVGF